MSELVHGIGICTILYGAFKFYERYREICDDRDLRAFRESLEQPTRRESHD